MDEKIYKNNLEKLKMGAILRNVQKENGEPENVALGQISKELAFYQRQSQYAMEIDRVLKELRLTTVLIGKCRTCDLPEGITRQELLAYYQGGFLDLVHQAKDKITKLVNLISEKQTPEKPSGENDIRVSKLIKNKEQIIQEIGILDEVKEWEEEGSTSGIAVALRKRTQHHHRISGLRYDNDFLNLGFTDIATQPTVQQSLSDYGKEQIEKMRKESSERLYSGAFTEVENTLKLVEANVEKISAALIAHFKLPTSQEEIKQIMEKQAKMLNSFTPVNRCSIDKVPEPQKSMLDDLVAKMRERYGDHVISIYLIGSMPRGEYEEGYSDINIYVIFNVEDPTGQAFRENPLFSLRVFTQQEFLSEQSQRYRIIAKVDGILLYGSDLLKDEKLPKAGLLLAYALYGDIIEILDRAKRWMEENPKATPMQISIRSRRLAKRLIDFIYAVAMSNKPQFTASRKERAQITMELFGDEKVIDTLMGVSRYGVGEFESFGNIIEGFRPKAEMNLKKMQDVNTHITSSKGQ